MRRSSSGSASSSLATMPPIGSSTSGTQMSSRLGISWSLGRLANSPQGDLSPDGDQEHGEEAPERELGKGLGREHPARDAGDRGDADHERRPPADVPVPV